MITLEDYFGRKMSHPEATSEMKANAHDLLIKVNYLLADACEHGAYNWEEDPDTGTCISGSRGGAGDGGFRLSTSTTGAPKSNHRRAHAVDIYDPKNTLDEWITGDILQRHGLYREAPMATSGWVHFQDVPPASGNRTYGI